MKAMTVKLPDTLMSRIEAEARRRGMSKSDVVRDRLERAPDHLSAGHLDDIADLIGSVVDDLPADLSARKKHYLRVTGYGRKRSG